MEELKVIGLDLAKNVFQVHGINSRGRKLCGCKLKRGEVLAYFANLPPVLVGMEACGCRENSVSNARYPINNMRIEKRAHPVRNGLSFRLILSLRL